jgi:hypothetical protein
MPFFFSLVVFDFFKTFNMEINYCLKKGKGKGNLYLPSFVVTLFCRRALMSSRSYVAALLCRRALMSHALLSRALFAARFCRDTA